MTWLTNGNGEVLCLVRLPTWLPSPPLIVLIPNIVAKVISDNDDIIDIVYWRYSTTYSHCNDYSYLLLSGNVCIFLVAVTSIIDNVFQWPIWRIPEEEEYWYSVF